MANEQYLIFKLNLPLFSHSYREQTSMFQSVSNLIDNAACGLRIATDPFFQPLLFH
jgi:hypothetical protein